MLIGPRDTYQPSQSHPHLNDVKAESRDDWGLPEGGFIILFPGTTNRVGEKTAFQYYDLLCKPDFRDAFMLFLDRPETTRFEFCRLLNKYIEAKKDSSEASLRDRILFRPYSDGATGFYGLIDAARRGKGAVGISSFDSVVPHTTVQDLLKRQMVVFATENPDGLMSDRVAAEVLKAAGLGELCVGQSDEETMEKLRQYKLSPVIQRRAQEHLKMIIDEGLGVFNTKRTPVTWKAVLDYYLQADSDAGGDRASLQDFHVPPQNDFLAPVLDPHGGSAVSVTVGDIIKALKGTEPAMDTVTEVFLTGFALEARVEYLGVTGEGSYVNTICCRQSDGKLGALKLGKESRVKERIHNDPVMREAAYLGKAHEQMRKCDIKVFPEPYFVLEKGTSFAGTTLPDARGQVLTFLFCEFVEKEFAKTFARHAELFQTTGEFHNSLRLECFCPFLLALHRAHAKGFYILDLKPDNVRIGENGRVVFTDLNLGHYLPALVKGGPNGAPCLLVRRSTTLLTEEQAAATGHQRRLPRGKLQGRRPKRGAHFTPITRAEFREFWKKASVCGLADLGGGARAFQDPRMLAELKASRSQFIVGSGVLKAFNRKWASSTDKYAAYTTLLQLLTRKKGEPSLVWDERKTKAIKAGRNGIKKLFLDSMNPGIMVQQELALAKMVDLFALAFGSKPDSGERCDEFSLLTHEMNTTPILKPEYDKILRNGGGIPVGGGCVRDMFNCPYRELWGETLPLLEFALQEGMGMGVRAKESIPSGTIIAPYAGKFVRPHMLGEMAAVLSRYQTSSQGNIPLLKELDLNKLSCDAQADAVHDFDWAVEHGNSGPYFNAGRKAGLRAAELDAWSDDEYPGEAITDTAPEAGSDDKDAKDQVKANCMLDRVRAWGSPQQGRGVTPELLCMFMIGSRQILEGEFLMWPYNPKAAGGGRSFH